MDEYSKLAGAFTPGAVTGKPLGNGGSPGRTEATGYGVIAMAKKRKLYPRDAAYMVAIDRVVQAMKLRGWVETTAEAAHTAAIVGTRRSAKPRPARGVDRTTHIPSTSVTTST